MAGNVWTPNANGEAYLANNSLSESLRKTAQPLMRFRQFVTMEDGRQLHKGQSKLITRMGNVNNSGSTTGISETQKTPETNVTYTRTTITVTEFGNSIPWTGLLENLSEFDVANNDAKLLRDDMAKTLNSACASKFTGNKLKYTPTGTTASPTATWATGGTVSASATRNIQVWDTKQIVDTMIETYIVPFYDSSNYIAIGPSFSLRQIFDDNEYNEALKYGDPEKLFAGEVTRYYKTRYIEDDHAISSTLGTTSYKGQFVFFGWDAVAEVLTEPEELRRKLSVDYGRDKGVGWFYTGNWGEVYPVATAGQVKIVHVTSA